MINFKKKIPAVIGTRKRKRIIGKLSSFFDFSICEGILLSGSMVYGKNNSIRADSDIDLLLVIKAENIFKLKQYPFSSSIHYDNHTLELFHEKLAQTFYFDVFVDGIMINIVVCEYGYFENLCNLKESKILRAKLDDTLDIIRSRKLQLSDGRTIQDAPTQRQDGTNYIVTYDLYDGDAIISRPIFGNIAMSEILYSKNDLISKLIESFVENLKKRLDEKSLILLFDYVLSKATPKYKEKFMKEVLK